MSAPVDVEHLVIGLGGLGSAAAYWLARRGAPVVGLEQYGLGHDRGASHDHSRIIRLSYHTPFYVELAKAAYDAWSVVEADSGEQIVVRCGGLDLFPAGGSIPASDYTGSLVAAGVTFEWLDAAEMRRRWPVLAVADDTAGLFQAEGGIAAAARGTAAHQRLAREHGAELFEHTEVVDVASRDGEVGVTLADGRRLRCRRLVLTADAWTNVILARLGAALPIVVTQEQLAYFEAHDPDAVAPGRLPVWIWMDEPCYYGFPVFGEPGAVKAAEDCGGQEVTAQTRTFQADQQSLDRLTGFVRQLLPGQVGPVRSTKTCLYTLTPDRDFVLDHVPGHPEVIVALGSAHGFKFASQFGRMLADLAIDGATPHDLSPFAIDRDVLTMDDPPRTWMV